MKLIKTGMGKTGMGKTGMGKTGMGKDFVMPLKSNRNIALSGQDKKDGRFQERRALSRKTGAFKKDGRFQAVQTLALALLGSPNARTRAGAASVSGTGTFSAAFGEAGLYKQRRQPGPFVSGDQR